MDKELALPAFIRISLAIAFIVEGIRKLFLTAPVPVTKIITFLAPGTSLYLIGVVETAIGLLLLLGLITRVAGWAAAGFSLLAVTLALAAGMGFLAEKLVLIAAALWVAHMGAARFSLDAVFAKKL